MPLLAVELAFQGNKAPTTASSAGSHDAPALLGVASDPDEAGAAASLVIAQTVTAVLLARRLGRELDMHPLRMMIPNAEDARLLRAALARGLGRG